jgi:hypothetical protein
MWFKEKRIHDFGLHQGGNLSVNEKRKEEVERGFRSSPTYLRCGVTLNVDDHGKKESITN